MKSPVLVFMLFNFDLIVQRYALVYVVKFVGLNPSVSSFYTSNLTFHENYTAHQQAYQNAAFTWVNPTLKGFAK
jgi:hypothetical protein